jgi:hypothetical protein
MKTRIKHSKSLASLQGNNFSCLQEQESGRVVGPASKATEDSVASPFTPGRPNRQRPNATYPQERPIPAKPRERVASACNRIRTANRSSTGSPSHAHRGSKRHGWERSSSRQLSLFFLGGCQDREWISSSEDLGKGASRARRNLEPASPGDITGTTRKAKGHVPMDHR